MRVFADIQDFFQRIIQSFPGVSRLPSRQPRPLPHKFSPNRNSSGLHQKEKIIQQINGLLRIALVIVIVYFFFPWFGGTVFEKLSADEVAKSFREVCPLLKRIPDWFLYRLDWRVARYMIPPLAAIVAIFIAGSSYVHDIYNLKDLKLALRYVVTSMIGFFSPELRIDGGRKDIPSSAATLLDVIGGPGTVLIEQGNAVIFRKLNEVSDISITQAYFMGPFEKIGSIASLEDQEGLLDDVLTATRDGIRVRLTDVHFRYRIVPMVVDGRMISPSLDSPFPYSEEALRNMAYNLNINATGPDSWPAAVHRFVRAAITDYINSHSIDHLTAPRGDTDSPREGLRIDLFSEQRQEILRYVGAELVWIDVGHIDIIPEQVDDLRVQTWASDWIGDNKKAYAYADAIRLAYTEIARGEAQAEMILAIANALDKINLAASSKENLRSLLLLRTAQILDAMRDNNQAAETKYE